jgi:hypothetical protein
MQRLKSGQWDSEQSFNVVLFQLRSESAYRFTVTFGLVDGVYESSCGTWHYVLRNLYSEVFNTTVTEDYETN